MTWFFYGLIIQLNKNQLIVKTKLNVLPNSEIAGKKIKLSLFTAISHTRLIGYSYVVT